MSFRAQDCYFERRASSCLDGESRREGFKKNCPYCKQVIVDANDLGVAVFGKSNNEISDDFCEQVFKDNPLGQTTEQTLINDIVSR